MFIGHVGVALGAKRVAPGTSLGTLVLAAQFIDVLWPVLLILGLEHVCIRPGDTLVTPLEFRHYPWTHSLAMVLVWAVAFGGLYFAIRRQRRAALVCGGLVLSHWFLDLIVHRPDLPLYPGSALYGLGLWNSRGASLAVEATIFCVGLLIYLRATRARRRAGTWGFAALIGVILAAYVANILGPPPPSLMALQWTALASMLLLVAWSGWVDRGRSVIQGRR